MLTESQIFTLEQIAARLIKDGRNPGVVFDIRAHFNRLMEGAMFADRTLTQEQFMKEAREVFDKIARKTDQ
jgi:hypothetical protein